MTQSTDALLRRIDAALIRIEAAAKARPAPDDRLRDRAREALAVLDDVIARIATPR